MNNVCFHYIDDVAQSMTDESRIFPVPDFEYK